MDGEVSQEILTEAHAKNDLYDKSVTPEQKASFKDAGITGLAVELLWDGQHATKTPEGKFTEDTKERLVTHLSKMEEHVQAQQMDPEQKNKFAETIDGFKKTVKVGDEITLDELIEEEKREAVMQERMQKAIALAGQGDLKGAHAEMAIGTTEDVIPFDRLLGFFISGEEPTDTEIQALNASFAKKGMSKEELAMVLKITKFDESTQKKILETYVPPEKPATDESKVSPEGSTELQGLLKKAQEAAKHVDSNALEYEDQRRLAAIWNLLERFDDRLNGAPEKVGKFALTLTGGVIIAIILVVLAEINLFHKFGAKK
jgi:hypothetical protein